MSSKEKKLSFLLSFRPNPRMEKRLAIAKEHGPVHLLYWDKGLGKQKDFWQEDLRIEKITVKAEGNPVKRMRPYRKFREKALISLQKEAPDLIHLQGLDMLSIAVAYKKKHKPTCKIVYEVADLHRYLMDKSKHPAKLFMRNYLRREDRKLMQEVDLLILTSPKYYELYFKNFCPESKVLVLENLPDLSAFHSFQENRKLHEPFTLSFIGSVRYKEQMRILLDVAEQLPIQVLIAGFEEGDDEIEKRAAQMANVTWYGAYDYKRDIAKLYEASDAIYSVYNADLSNVRVAMPNKYYESIYCKKPIIVAKETYLASRVEERGIGLAIDWKSEDALAKAVLRLQDPSVYKQMQAACEKYQYEIDGKRNEELLAAAYDRLIG